MACIIARDRKGNIMGVHAPNSKPSLLYDSIVKKVGDRELSLKIWTIAYTPSFMKRTENWGNLQLDQNGEPIVQFKGDDYTFLQKDSILENIQAPRASFTQDQYVSILNDLSNKFGVKWTIDNEQVELGRISNGQVFVNLKKIQPDTPFHEYAHIFEQVIKTRNKRLWDNLSRKITPLTYRGIPILDFVKKRYPELTGDNLTSEAITTAIGLAAIDSTSLGPDTAGVVSWLSSIKAFFKWIADYMNELIADPSRKIKAEDLSENMRFKDLADLLKAQNPVDVSGVNFTDSEQRQSLTESEVIKTIYQQNEGVVLNENDPNKTYYERAGQIYKRLTEWVTENLSSESKKKAYANKSAAEWAADKYYRKRNIPTSEVIKWDSTGKDVTYNEVVKLMEESLNKTRIDGNIVHAFIEDFIKDSQEVRDKIEQYMQEGGYDGAEWKWKWLNDNYIQQLLIKDLGLNIGERYAQSPLMDKIASEVTVASDILGIGSRIDTLVEHSNGSVSIIDFKTGGGFLNDSNTFDQMPYGELIDDIIKDSKLDKAKMELMLRALILKEKNPDLKFRDLRIAHVRQGRKARIFDVSMKNYLQVLSEYFKNTDSTKFIELQKAGLLKFENYTSASKELTETIEQNETFRNMPKEDQVQVLLNQLETLELKFKDVDEEELSPDVKRKKRELASQILELKKESSQDFSADNKDMSWLERWLGVFYEVANPVVQKFVRVWQDAKFRALGEYNDLRITQQKLLKPILQDYYRKNPTKVVGNKFIGNSIVYHTENGDGLYDFMWERKTIGNDEGYFARTITEDDVNSGTYTQAQFEYNKWYRNKLKDLWNDTMKVKVGKQTKEQLWGGTYGWSPSFMPRIPISQEEIAEREGRFSKDYLQGVFTNYSDFFVKEQYRDVNNNFIGMPVKYTGSQTIIVTQNHSLNAEQAMLMFAQNMINKRNLDPINALGQGVMSMLKRQKDPATNKLKFKNTLGWLDDFLKRQVTGQHDDLQLSRKGVKIPFTDKEVNWTRLFDSANNWVSASTMWLNVPGGMFNSIMFAMYNLKEAIKGSWAKRVGFNMEDIDYTLTDFFKGTQHWLREGLLPNLKDRTVDSYKDAVMKSKLYRFVELMNFDTNTFTYAVDKGDLLSAKNTLMDTGLLYMTHSIGEEYGSFSQMAAMLERKKVKDAFGNWIKIGSDGSFTTVATPQEATSMWDAYEVTKDGAFAYRGPIRGVLTDGTEIKGLTPDEINKMRRFNQRINGSYREDEKAAIEMWAVGRWIMKFKKYLPAIISGNFQSKFNDWSIGNYQEIAKDAEGRSVFEWSTRVNEGRFNIFLKFVTYGLANKFSDSEKFNSYRWENLSPEQKKLLMDATVAAFLWFSLFLGGLVFWDDDEDKESKLYRRYQRLVEDMVQIHPMDLLRHTANPLLQTQQLYKTAEAANKFLFDGLVMGERVESGPNAGNLPGEAYLRSKTPVINIANQFGLLDGEDDPEQVSFLNRR